MDAPLEDPSSWPALEAAATASGELMAAVGAKYLVLIDDTYSDQDTGELKAPERLDGDGWRRLIDTTHRMADLVAARFGATLVFHPHADTHVEYIEKFLEDTDPGRVSLCLDIGHHAYRGGDPVAFMRKYHERIPYLHLKSVDRELQQKVEAEGATFATAVGMGVFCEPADGVIDFPGLADLLHEIEFDGFAIVEQDMFPVPFDRPLPIALRTHAYLREIGIAEKS